MVLGSKYFSESGDDKSSIVKLDELQAMLDEWFLLNGVFNIGDWIPWLSFLDLQGYVKRMKALYKRFDKFHNYVIDDHQTKRAKDKDSIPRDMVDVLLQQAEDSDLDVKLTRDHIKGLLQDLLVGGTDTSATTIEWAIHEILKNPRIIEKAKEELDRVIGRNRWVEEDDFSKLPYIDAIIMESMRLHPLGTFLIPHSAMEDCKVAGYDISKGTMILINTWSIGRDPNSWDAPEKFLPERFLGKETDILGSNFALLPFGSGRRRCPGYPLALKIVRTMLANLLRGFNLKLVDGMRPGDICMEEFYGLATHPKKPLTIIMEPTLPDNFY
ncbi:Trimethyltridecatetraene synthase [Sesamum angolense]|uniref:Trimethyltridecatetraene synthase n=1 Tax=Sesamum angolense TaxID=2727404 RepID=A0AAE1WUY9_9LAMI|nr:Trimethyltridecatetraene synthase [Sesamum angolense]